MGTSRASAPCTLRRRWPRAARRRSIPSCCPSSFSTRKSAASRASWVSTSTSAPQSRTSMVRSMRARTSGSVLSPNPHGRVRRIGRLRNGANGSRAVGASMSAPPVCTAPPRPATLPYDAGRTTPLDAASDWLMAGTPRARAPGMLPAHRHPRARPPGSPPRCAGSGCPPANRRQLRAVGACSNFAP